MRKNQIAWVVGSLLALAACGVTEQEERGAASEETAEVTGAIEAAASGRWYLVSTRNCLTDFRQVCSETVPARQCVDDAVPNWPCPTVGVGCNKVLSSTGYQVLKCI